MKLAELGREAGGIDYATVSVATKRWEKLVAKEGKLLKLQKRAEEMLNAKM